MDSLTFDISGIINAENPATLNYSFDDLINLEESDLTANLKGDVEIMRLPPDSFNVVINNLAGDTELSCSKCLTNFFAAIDIPHIEREYYEHPPENLTDPNDTFVIDRKKLTLSILEPIRQEITLQFPVNPVCSASCKGICSICGQNRNEKDCDCQPEPDLAQKPLAALKDLIKKQNG